MMGSTALDEVQIRAAAASLHSIYNGVEKILLMILEDRKVSMAEAAGWHSEVLSVSRHAGIISEDMESQLRGFMGFRHFFRHNYGFVLDDALIKPLMIAVRPALSQLVKELNLEAG